MKALQILWRGLACVLVACALPGCHNNCECPEPPECAPQAAPQPPPAKPPTPKSAEAAPTPPARKTPPPVQKSQSEQEVEQLKKDIEELRKQLRISSATQNLTIVNPLEPLKKQLENMDSGFPGLVHLSIERLIQERIAVESELPGNIGAWKKRTEIRRILLSRLDEKMTREEVHRILGSPAFAMGDADYYPTTDRTVFQIQIRRWGFSLRERDPSDSIQLLPAVYVGRSYYAPESLDCFYCICYRDNRFSRLLKPRKKTKPVIDVPVFWGPGQTRF